LQKVEIDIRRYQGQREASFNIGDLKRRGRVDKIDPELWIVSNDPECFNDVPCIVRSANMLADKLRPYDLDCLLMPETRALMTGIEIARVLGIEKTVVARKNIKPAPLELLEINVGSITSGIKTYKIDENDKRILTNARAVGVFDDVFSTCGTVMGMLEFGRMTNARVAVISAIGIEGTEPYVELEDWIRQERLVYLNNFPLWATGNTYKAMKQEEAKVRARYADLPVGRSEPRP
jgi:adenine/guanine phosphoribosyltransferase-like PRPP-binding protein